MFYDKCRQNIKKQRHRFTDKSLYSQSYGFSSSHVQMWELDHKEGWATKNWCFQNMVLEKTLESPFSCKEIKPVNPKRNQPWILIGKTDAETEAPILWPLDVKSQLIGKDPDAGKGWGQEETGTTADEMVLGITDSMDVSLGDGEEQRSLSGCSPWVTKSQTQLSDWTTSCLSLASQVTQR